jgi:CMP/dCMP kinase
LIQEVIAIDGVSYVGKSQIAKALSRLLGFSYVNTGHMYRALAKLALKDGVGADNKDLLLKILNKTSIEFSVRDEEWRTIVNNDDWTDALDHSEIVIFSSKIAAIPEIRWILTEKQRHYALKQTIIMEGRDIGSVVFPNARWKFFITATAEVRAKRMQKMMRNEINMGFSSTQLIEKVKGIDEADRNRKIAPLIEGRDALIYDNSESPSAEEDALILRYHINHCDEQDRERGQIKFNYQEVIAQHGKLIRT